MLVTSHSAPSTFTQCAHATPLLQVPAARSPALGCGNGPAAHARAESSLHELVTQIMAAHTALVPLCDKALAVHLRANAEAGSDALAFAKWAAIMREALACGDTVLEALFLLYSRGRSIVPLDQIPRNGMTESLVQQEITEYLDRLRAIHRLRPLLQAMSGDPRDADQAAIASALERFWAGAAITEATLLQILPESCRLDLAGKLQGVMQIAIALPRNAAAAAALIGEYSEQKTAAGSVRHGKPSAKSVAESSAQPCTEATTAGTGADKQANTDATEGQTNAETGAQTGRETGARADAKTRAKTSADVLAQPPEDADLKAGTEAENQSKDRWKAQAGTEVAPEVVKAEGPCEGEARAMEQAPSDGAERDHASFAVLCQTLWHQLAQEWHWSEDTPLMRIAGTFGQSSVMNEAGRNMPKSQPPHADLEDACPPEPKPELKPEPESDLPLLSQFLDSRVLLTCWRSWYPRVLLLSLSLHCHCTCSERRVHMCHQ